MKTFVFDATPLIHLGKITFLDYLTSTKNLIPKSVYDEVIVAGKSLGKDDVMYLEKLIKKGIFSVVRCDIPFRELPIASLSFADREVLSIAKQYNGYAVIDELAGRRVASLLDIKTVGSLGIIIDLVTKKKITKKNAKLAIDVMIENGWFCSPSLYTKILGELGMNL